MRPVPLIALSLALVACGGHRAQSSAGSELAWVHGISVWLHRLDVDVYRAETFRRGVLGGQPSARAGYKRTVDRLADCADRFDDHVGAAPVARLAPGARMVREACVAFARGERDELESLGRSPGNLLADGTAAVDRGADLLLRGRKQLEATFKWNAPLRRAGGETGESRVEPRFSRIASTFALRRIQVRCWSNGDWREVSREFRAYNSTVTFEPAGFVGDRDSASVDLAPWVCAHLVDLSYAHRVRHGDGGLDTADAVDTLAHEAEHVVGPAGTEAETECYAIQDVRHVARLLGASTAYADELARRQWRENYPRENAGYTTPLCHDGGPLDANPETSRWP
jgi:hypothetical protein